MMAHATARHQQIMKFVGSLLDAYFSERAIGQVIYPPFLMRLPQKPSGREPDLLVLLDTSLERLRPAYLDGPADIVVEIVSEESQDRDRGVKFSEYEAAGITEYWLLDPLRNHADFYRLGEHGRYQRVEFDADGRFQSAVLPGLALNPNWLWAQQLPTLAETLAMVHAMLAE